MEGEYIMSVNIKKRLKAIGFIEEDTKFSINLPNDYIIEVLKQDRFPINYGNGIKVWHRSTSNLSKEENFVVLECVIRLIKKGYLPADIELEKDWKLGHEGKGRLDVFLKNPSGKSFALIECKTWGEEYSKERTKTLEEGGQLFSYFVQERASNMMYLYTSKIEGDNIQVQTEYIDSTKLRGTNNDEIFKSWDRSFIPNGIFDQSATLYDINYRNIIKCQLKELDSESGKGVFFGFADILRQHAVSDKSNAFNKIFNLFVCKIIDEDRKRDNEELDFQWKHNDTFQALLSRLEVLYKDGLKRYLQIEITDRYFSPILEFSFIDVYDQISFNKNGQILREVVELLQQFRIKYTEKHQFLGDFFESLLSTGIKQEAGQFFTSIPLARFILRSIPIGNIIEGKLQKGEIDFLPYVIDYACGSGHFITEAMDEIQTFVDLIDVEKLTGRTKSRFLSKRHDYLWAMDSVYGIEKDYRLTKTTKIATFLNGDGDANIINGDGLDDFYESETYHGILKVDEKSNKNERFDIVVSNPPYSIDNFKNHVVNGLENFELYGKATFQSSEIECLFLERTNQLLANNGSAGIIYPLSLLNNNKTIYNYTRKMMLINFEVIGLIELGDKAFIATPTTTVVTFLKKRDESQVFSDLNDIYDYFVNNARNKEIKESVIEEFLLESDMDNEAFGNLLQKEPFFLGESTSVIDMDNEIVKLLIFYLNYDRNTIISFAGETAQKQQHYLGYRFSKGRRNEGIHLLEDEDSFIDTMLYDTLHYENNEKVSTHIRNNFIHGYSDVPEDIKNHTRIKRTIDLINKDLTIDNPSQYFMLDDKDSVFSYSRFGDFIDDFDCKESTLDELVTLKKISILAGATYPKNVEVPYKTDKVILTATNISLENSTLIYPKVRYLKDDYHIPTELIPKANDVVISVASGSLRHLGKVAHVKEDIENEFIGGFLNILRVNDDRLSKVIFYNLLSKRFRGFIVQLRDQNINNLSPNQLRRFTIKIPNDLEAFIKKYKELES